MAKINPYLNFVGNTEEAFNFYKSVFGGEFAAVMRYKDAPADAQTVMKPTPDELEKILHIALRIGDNDFLMGTDVLKSMGGDFAVGDNFSVSISAENREEADRLFQKLSENASFTMPPADSFWGAYFGMCKDKFGVRWMINYDYNSK